MNAIYLWACFISRPGELSQHESHYLQQALSAIPDALTDLDKVVDVIQASCLIANYYLASGRFVEGNYHASAAAALCLQVGLDKPTALDLQPSEPDSKPNKSGPKDGERVLAFWQVYNLDRCWSVVLRKPGIIPTTGESRVEIYCPWPQEIGDYEAVGDSFFYNLMLLTWGQGFVDTNVTVPTIGAFLSGAVDATGFSNPALRAKASALFYHAEQLSMSWGSGISLFASRFTHWLTHIRGKAFYGGSGKRPQPRAHGSIVPIDTDSYQPTRGLSAGREDGFHSDPHSRPGRSDSPAPNHGPSRPGLVHQVISGSPCVRVNYETDRRTRLSLP